MTDKEIIDGLYEIKNWKCDGDAKMHSIIRGAINLLEQQPCEDCISRQAAINTVVFECGEWAGLAKEISKQLQQLPPVTPQPKTGHWITTRTFMHDGEFYCDKCKCDSPNNEKWDYCPNCGARMEVEE